MSTTTYGADSRYDWISLRGFDAYSPGFYLDGLPLRNNSTWGVWRTENYGAERIELLRGPSSVLYGSNTTAGLLNMVSKRPQEKELHEYGFQYVPVLQWRVSPGEYLDGKQISPRRNGWYLEFVWIRAKFDSRSMAARPLAQL